VMCAAVLFLHGLLQFFFYLSSIKNGKENIQFR
jgi:hypothetical protein